MSELILHHYAASPFAEKVRAILGYKQLHWRSVDIPVVMPKPDLLALTGGYRKTPVLQVGSDVYCDTSLIARVLDRLCPDPAIFHAGQGALGIAAGRFFDRELFFAVLAQLFTPAMAEASVEALGGAQAAAAFGADRARMLKGAPVRPPRPADGRVIIAQTLEQLEAQLAGGAPFLCGATVAWVDFCAYHPLWALRNNRLPAPQLAPYLHVRAWLDRIRALGHGTSTPLSASEALAAARGSEPLACPEIAGPTYLEGCALGDEVAVSASDYALEPSVGRLLYADAHEVAIARSDPRAGQVVVHFPRLGYRVRPAAALAS